MHEQQLREIESIERQFHSDTVKVDLVELVACMGGTARVIQDCPYEGGRWIKRFQAEVTITLREARTAEVVARHKIYSHLPEECPPMAYFGSEKHHFEYGVVPDSAITHWLLPFVSIH